MFPIQIKKFSDNPLASWEAPWNHMTYFWHNDPLSPEKNQVFCKQTPEEDLETPIEKRLCCRIKEIQLPPECCEPKVYCSKDIEAIKPVPWRNVYVPSNILCDRCRTSRRCTNQDDLNTVNEIMNLRNPEDSAASACASSESRKTLILKPLKCCTNIQKNESFKIYSKDKSNNSTPDRISPPILPLHECTYSFVESCKDKMEKKKKLSFLLNHSELLHSTSCLRDMKVIGKDMGSNSCEGKTSSAINASVNRPPKELSPTRECFHTRQQYPCSSNRKSFGKEEINTNDSSALRHAHLLHNCRCRINHSQVSKENIGVCEGVSNKSVLKIKKAPQPIRTSMENIDRWKEEAAEEARAQLFQSIRDASTEKNPVVKCDDEILNLSPTLCSFCNQPLSLFGNCNECIPPTPVPKTVPVEDEKQHSCCFGVNKSQSSIDNILSNANSLLQEISNFTSFQREGISSIPSINSITSSEIQSLLEPKNIQDISQSDAQFPIMTQQHTCQDHMQGNFLLPSLNQEMSLLNQAQRDWRSLMSTQPTFCPGFCHFPSMMPPQPQPPQPPQPQLQPQPPQPQIQPQLQPQLQPQPPQPQLQPPQPQPLQNSGQYPFNFHFSKDCPSQYPMEYNTNFNQRNLYFPPPLQHLTQNDPTGITHAQALSPCNIMPLWTANSTSYNSSRGSFAVTLHVGNALPQDINVILYANRVLVAEATNRTVKGDCVSAQSWALPPNVDVDALRCYLDIDKLHIIAHPPPTSFNWKFAKTPAALGPPKFLSAQCPFEP